MKSLGEMSIGEIAAYMVAVGSEVDLDEIERSSRHEGMEKEFQRIRARLLAKA